MPDAPLLTSSPTSWPHALRQWLQVPANQLLLLLLALAAVPLFLDLGRLPVQLWDESRQSVSAWEMAHGGNPLVLRYDGQPDHWYTKPPFLVWLQAISYRLFGVSVWAFRLPSALAALGTVWLVYRFAAFRLSRPLAGFFAGLVLVTAAGYVRLHGVRTGDYDSLLTLWITLSWIAFFEYLEDGQRRQLYWLGAAVTLAVVTKSVQGVLGLPALLVYALLRGRLWWLLRQPRLYLVAALGAAVVAGYYLAREHYDPGYWQAVLVNELGGRFNEVIEGHSGPWTFYFDNIYQSEFSFWVWWLLPAVLVWLQPRRQVRWAGLLLLVFTLGWLAVISAAATKLSWYTVPIYPPLALLLGLGLDYLYHDVLAVYLPLLQPRWHWLVRVGLVALVFYFPFRSVVRDILHQRTEDPDPYTADHQLIRYVHDSAEKNGPLGPVTLLGHGGYNASMNFYQKTLTEAGQGPLSVQHISYYRQLAPGTIVMVCDPVFRARLDSAFRLTTLAQEAPCETLLLEPR